MENTNDNKAPAASAASIGDDAGFQHNVATLMVEVKKVGGAATGTLESLIADIDQFVAARAEEARREVLAERVQLVEEIRNLRTERDIAIAQRTAGAPSADAAVDDALAKVSELGTVGAMKWLAANLRASLASAGADGATIPDAVQRAFITLESNAGAFSIVMKFNQRNDAYAAHSFLLGVGGKDWPAQPSQAPVREDGAVLPEHLREFVEAVADGHVHGVYAAWETCRDCGVDIDSRTVHAPDCIVLRAKALLTDRAALAQREQVAEAAAQATAARLPNGATVTNVYEAYEEGRKAAAQADGDVLKALKKAASLLRAAGFWMTGTATSQIVAAINAASICTVPPAGWRCTRPAGHEGPCAAIPTAAPAAQPTPGEPQVGQFRTPYQPEQPTPRVLPELSAAQPTPDAGHDELMRRAADCDDPSQWVSIHAGMSLDDAIAAVTGVAQPTLRSQIGVADYHAGAQVAAQPTLPDDKPAAWMVPISGVYEYYATKHAAERERAAYETAMGPDADHEEPVPLYLARAALRQPAADGRGEDAEDAARYRWLRDNCYDTDPASEGDAFDHPALHFESNDLRPYDSSSLDAAIDAARAARKGEA